MDGLPLKTYLANVLQLEFDDEYCAPPKQWCVEILDKLMPYLEQDGFENHVVWCFDGEPELLSFHPSMADGAHCRFIFGEDNGNKYGFISLGIQGKGCIQKETLPDDKGLAQVRFDFNNFRRMMSDE